VYVTRITAPFPSSTSLPQLSHTSTVFRATVLLLENAIDRENYRNSAGAMQPHVHVEFATNEAD
jgi:hypothetical protein